MKEYDFSHLHEGCIHNHCNWCGKYCASSKDINFRCEDYKKVSKNCVKNGNQDTTQVKI